MYWLIDVLLYVVAIDLAVSTESAFAWSVVCLWVACDCVTLGLTLARRWG